MEVITTPGVWNDFVVEGFADIIYSRFLWLYSELQGGSVVFETLAGLLEESGRSETGPAPAAAGTRFALQIHDVVTQARADHGPTHPVYIDLIGHSRGGLAAHHTALALDAAYGYSSDPNIHVSYTSIDAIDTSGPYPGMPTPLARPLAYAGELLSTFAAINPPADRTNNIYAEFAARPGDSSWFGDDLFDYITTHFGTQLDEWLVLRGLPLGRPRPELSPESDRLYPGAGHGAIMPMIADDFDLQSAGSAPILPYSITATTYFGDLIQNPLMEFTPTSAVELAEPIDPAQSVRSAENLLALDAATDGCSALIAAQSAALDMDFRAAVPGDLSGLLTDIDAAVASGFPLANAWAPTADTPAMPTLACAVEGEPDAAFELNGGAAMVQTLAAASMSLDEIEFSVDALLLGAAPSLSLRIVGIGIDDVFPVTPPPGAFPDERFTTSIIAERGGSGGCEACPDRVTVMGDGAYLFDVGASSVVPGRPADVNNDGVVDSTDLASILAVWEQMHPLDLTGDGIVNSSDLAVILAAWDE